MYYLNYGLGKTWFHKCLKKAVSEYASTSNMENVPKHCSNLDEGSFIISIDYCEDK